MTFQNVQLCHAHFFMFVNKQNLVSESNDPRKKRHPSTAKIKSNGGHYFRNSMVLLKDLKLLGCFFWVSVRVGVRV